jgi:hypothetical protein
MKLKALLLALCTAGFAVSIAVAASPAAVEKGKPGAAATSTESTSTGTTTDGHGKGKGKGHSKAAACKPNRKLELQGEFVAAGAGGFAMTVKHANKGAKALAGKQVSVLVDAKTHFHGAKHKLADLVAGDRLMVQAFACKAAESAAGQTATAETPAATTSILARKVGVKGAKAAKPEDEDDEKDDKDETTTESTSTGTTTGS